MPQLDALKNNWTAGELSPLLLGRTDFDRYQAGVARLENWLVLLEGGVRTRYGTRYVATAKRPDTTVILLPFEPTATQAYVIEAGDFYFRFYTNSAQLQSSGTPVEVTTPYAAADVRRLRTAQANDVMFLAHGTYAPRKLSRLTSTTFDLQLITFGPPPTYEAGVQPGAILTPSAQTGSITLTADASVFLKSDVQRVVSAGTARAVITGYTSGTVVTADVLDTFSVADLAGIAAGGWTLDGSPFARLKPDTDMPVGGQIVLDLQKEQPENSELVTNGAFASDLSGWTDHSGGTLASGWHDGSANSDVLEDSGQDFEAAGVEVGHRIFNLSDDSVGVVAVVTTTRLTLNPTLAGGTDDDFDASFVAVTNGTHDGPNNAVVLTDSGATFVTTGVLTGMIVQNVTDGSEGVANVVAATTITLSPALSGGTDDDFDTGDAYNIGHPGDRYEVRKTGLAGQRDGKARLDGGTNGVAWIEQGISTVANRFYRLLFDVADAPLSVQIGASSQASDITAEATYAIQNEHEILFQATGTTTYLQFRNNQNAASALDNVSCKLYSIDGFRAADVGKYLKLHGGLVEITEFVDATQVKGELLHALTTDATAAAGAWTLEDAAWSDALGWPSVVLLYEGRAYFAGSATFPQTIWGSAVDDLFNFFVGTNADDAVQFTLQDSGGNIVLNQIRALMPAENLLALTTRAEYRLIGSGDDPLTPLSPPRVRVQSTYGSTTVQPLKVGPALLFVQRQGSAVREMAFQETTQNFVARNLSRLSGHLLSATVHELVYQAEGTPTVWGVRSDGTLLGLTYDLTEQVEAWHHHVTDGSYESVAVIPHPTALADQLWCVVTRGTGGQATRFIEYFDEQAVMSVRETDGTIRSWTGLTVDSGVVYTNPASATLTGLEHLEGKRVVAVGDGAVFPAQEVSGGSITLSLTPSVAWVGLPYTCTGETLPYEVLIRGTTQRGLKRWVELTARVYQTIGLTIEGERMPFRTPGMPMTEGVAPQTGDYVLTPPGGYDKEARITFVQDQPLPATVLALIGVIDVEVG